MTCTEYELITKVYVGHDNHVAITPYANIAERILYDMTDVTEVTVSADLTASVATGDDVEASSDDDPVTVWWAMQDDDSWQIFMKVGRFTGITAGEYKLRVIIYEPEFANGLVIADDLLVTAVEVP